jgi:hypothetical protein
MPPNGVVDLTAATAGAEAGDWAHWGAGADLSAAAFSHQASAAACALAGAKGLIRGSVIGPEAPATDQPFPEAATTLSWEADGVPVRSAKVGSAARLTGAGNGFRISLPVLPGRRCVARVYAAVTGGGVARVAAALGAGATAAHSSVLGQGAHEFELALRGGAADEAFGVDITLVLESAEVVGSALALGAVTLHCSQ